MSTDMDSCSFCGNQQPASGVETWTFEGVPLAIPQSFIAWACVNCSAGELWICEHCYEREAFRTLKAEDRAEVHYQMGLEFASLEDYQKSIAALERALELTRTPNILATLALNYQRTGKVAQAKRLYSEALELEPNHFMATENLKNIDARRDSDGQSQSA